MSTSFTLMSDVNKETCIALRFWGGAEDGVTVRFAFPEVLFQHLKNIQIVGSDGVSCDIETLSFEAETLDFLTEDVSPRDHISHGTNGARKRREVHHVAR